MDTITGAHRLMIGLLREMYGIEKLNYEWLEGLLAELW